MHPPPIRRALHAAVVFFCLTITSFAQDAAPPELWDLATGAQIPAADTAKTKDFGAIVADATGSMPRKRRRALAAMAISGDIRPGDIILAVDGMRTFGRRDFELARFRNALSNSMTLLINREGDMLTVKLHDLQPGRDIGLHFNASREEGRILDAVENLGVALTDDKIRASLYQLPAQAAAELDAWSKNTKAAGDTAWLQDFINLYTALKQRHYADAAQPAHQSPIPYFQKLEEFYLAIAAANKAKEVEPDLKQSGETAEFYVLSLPVPDYQPPFGDLKFTDRRFQALLTRKYALGAREDAELTAAAEKYASTGTDGLDQYLNQVKASLIDPSNQGGWPYRSYLLQKPVSRDLMVQELTARMKDAAAPDWALDASAMVALKFSTDASDEVASLIDNLGKQSPYLARIAADGVFYARHLTKNNWKLLDPTRKVLDTNNYFLGKDAPVLYFWALDKVAAAAKSSQEISPNPLPDPYTLLTGAPYAEWMVLKGVQLPAPALTGTNAAQDSDDATDASGNDATGKPGVKN